MTLAGLACMVSQIQTIQPQAFKQPDLGLVYKIYNRSNELKLPGCQFIFWAVPQYVNTNLKNIIFLLSFCWKINLNCYDYSAPSCVTVKIVLLLISQNDGPKVIIAEVVHEWVRFFNNGRTNFHEEERSGRLSLVTDEHIEKIGGRIHSNHYLKQLSVDHYSLLQI